MAEKRNIFGHIGLLAVTLIMFFPLYTVFVMGTYYSEDIFKGLPIWFSDYFFYNLRTVLGNDYARAYMNSILVSVGSVLFSVTVSSLVGYAIAKFRFALKKFMFALLIAIMMIPAQITIIGYVVEMRTFGMLGTLTPLIFVWIAHPFGAFFMTQFIRDSVPDEVLESGRMDGCSEPGVFFRLVVPFIRPALLTLATMVFLWSWNSYMIPLIVINRQELFTIPLMISTLSNTFRSDYGAIMCALSISIFPIIIIFCFSARTFVKGIAAGAVKG